MQTKIQKIVKKAKEKFSQKSQASGDSSVLDSSGPTLEDIELPKTAKIFLFGREQSLAKLKKSHGFIFVGDIKVSFTLIYVQFLKNIVLLDINKCSLFQNINIISLKFRNL